MKRLAFAVVAILMGFFAGLVMTGRLHRAPAGEVAAAAQPGGGDQAAAPAGAGARAAAGLPDFTAVADRAVGAVTNISSAQVVRSS
ncbi:MAG TPA: hypothetical protein PKZ08_09730, partial [Vicinamibacterales bacterium]|nr:hypothetical protein [Vicinamibacterales bacterium]